MADRKALTCVDCGASLVRAPGRGRPRARCSPCAATRRRAERKGERSVRPCRGSCGRLAEPRHDYCLTCPGLQRVVSEPRPPMTCEHPACDVVITAPTSRQRWCSKTCSDRAPSAKPRNARKNARRRPSGGGMPSGWPKLRAQVLAEEPDCWICAQPIDPKVYWPAPMAGTGDHVVPLEAGGAPLDRENVRAAHFRCNQRRHAEWKRQERARRRGALRVA